MLQLLPALGSTIGRPQPKELSCAVLSSSSLKHFFAKKEENAGQFGIFGPISSLRQHRHSSSIHSTLHLVSMVMDVGVLRPIFPRCYLPSFLLRRTFEISTDQCSQIEHCCPLCSQHPACYVVMVSDYSPTKNRNAITHDGHLTATR